MSSADVGSPAFGGAPRDPEELEAEAPPTGGELSPDTALGAVHLTVADLGRSIDYYSRAIGLEVVEQRSGRVALGAAGRKLLELSEQPGARQAPGHTGLYHFALLLPERVDLARWLAHAASDRVRLVGASDHFVSEALYLSDPDGHGIEIYWDRPREVWEGQVAARMTTLPLDIDEPAGRARPATGGALRGHAGGNDHGPRPPQGGRRGRHDRFFRDVLGFGLMAQLGGQAAFLAAGGYHHHIGANTWESAGASPPPPGSAALRHATIVLAGEDQRDRLLDRVRASGQEPVESAAGPLVRDPSGNALALTLARA